MSELCYKSIALDVTEDKKHIDLSSEPMTLVCATGLTGSAAADVAKEIAIFRAHKGVPVVVATDGAEAFADDENLISVPPVHAGSRVCAVHHGRAPFRLRGRARD